jgi:putative hemolysin
MDAIAWQLLLLELALVSVLAILSAGEAAINIVRRPGMADELEVRGRRGKRAGAIGRRAGYYLASIQVAEFLIVFTYAGIAAAFIAPRLSALLAFFLGIDTTAIFTDVSAVAVTVAVLSLIAVLFGLFVPRAIAARHAHGTLLLLAFPLELITWVTRPIVTAPQPGVVTEDQIRALIETGQAQGVLERKEQEMISSIFEMGDKTVADVMVPRTDIVGLDVTTTAQELLDRITTVGHSRIPVYEGSADNIIGILYVKDVFRRIARGDRQLELRQFLRPAVFVPETKKVDELLREMQKGKVHIAIVVDEYGGTAGLVTIEDLVEEIVGEIRDEYDVEHELVLPVSENEALMDARIPFEEVRETFGLEVRPTEAYETLGGFVTAQLGRFPRQGESFEAAGARFVVETIEGKRIRRVRVTRLQPSAEPA